MKKLFTFFSRVPFTLAMLVLLAFAGLLTNTYFEQISKHWLNHIGFAPNDLWYGRLERIFTSAVVTSGGEVFWQAVILVAIFVGTAEWTSGWKRAAASFWGVHFLTLVLLSLYISVSVHALNNIELEAQELARDIGPSAGYFSCLGLVSARLRRPWNWISGVILLVGFAGVLFLPPGLGVDPLMKYSADLAHLLAFPLGWFSSLFLPGLDFHQKHISKRAF